MNLAQLIKTGKEEGKEKHVPYIEIDTCESCDQLSVKVKVGKDVLHPTTPEHYIQWIEIIGITTDNKSNSVARFTLGSNVIPTVDVCLKKGVFKELVVLSFCNLHGLWENSIQIA